MHNARVFISMFMIRLRTVLQYRTAAWAGVLTQFAWGFMYVMLYRAFYDSSSAVQPISLSQLTSYIWLQQAFLAFIMIWFRDSELANMITGGAIAYELARPVDLYTLWYARLLGQRIAQASLRCLPILFVTALLPKPYALGAPGSFVSLLLFIPTLLLGVCLMVSLSMLVYATMFKTMNATGSHAVFAVFVEFLSGNIIPVPLMPAWMQKIIYLLPFRFVSDFPFRVYSGNIPPMEALFGLFQQLFWLAVVIALGKFLFSRLLRGVVIQGG